MGTKLERKEKKGSASVDQVTELREDLDEEDKRGQMMSEGNKPEKKRAPSG